MSAEHRKRTGERIRALEAQVARMETALRRYASVAAWEPMGDGLYAWLTFSNEGHPADAAQQALLGKGEG